MKVSENGERVNLAAKVLTALRDDVPVKTFRVSVAAKESTTQKAVAQEIAALLKDAMKKYRIWEVAAIRVRKHATDQDGLVLYKAEFDVRTHDTDS